MPLVSVISPVFNSSSYIKEMIKSVLSQTLQDLELILVDDCSSDDSVAIIKRLQASDPRIKLIQLNSNMGAAVARNTAIGKASGRYIAFLDSDDVWFPGKLEAQIHFMDKKNIAFSFTAYEKIDEQSNFLESIGVPNTVTYNQILKCCVIGCLTVMYDCHLLGKVYMPLIRKRQDLGLWLRLLKKTNHAYGLNETLAQYRVRTDSISANKINAAKFTWRLYREIEGLSFLKASYYFCHYAIRGTLRTKYPDIARVLGILH